MSLQKEANTFVFSPVAMFYQQQDLNRHLKKKHDIGRLERNDMLSETRMNTRNGSYIPKRRHP
jgi:hypothetical protein